MNKIIKNCTKIIPRKVIFFASYLQYVFYKKRKTSLRRQHDNGIYYFIPQVPEHFMHAELLHKTIGGTVITVSNKNKKIIEEKYDVKCVSVDDIEINNIMRFDSKKILKTFDYLNKNAKVVICYDLIDFGGMLHVPSIFLQHGVSVGKADAFWSTGNRLDLVKQFSAVSSVDHYTHDILLKSGVDSEKLANITITRTSEIVQKCRLFKIINKKKARNKIGLNIKQKVIVYMPSYWSKTSVSSTGLELLKNIDKEYTIIFWPHPQTDASLLAKYDNLAKERQNIIIGQKIKNLTITDLYAIADSFFSDPPTSVVSDIILAHKPIVFCRGYGNDGYGNNDETDDLHIALKGVVSTALELSYVASYDSTIINRICERAIKIGIDKKAYDNYINSVFYNTTGKAVVKTAEIIMTLMKGKK